MCREPVEESQSSTPAPRGPETTERVGEEHISETEGQVSCNRGRRKTSKPMITSASEEGGDKVGESRDGVDGVTKAKADGERIEEGLDRVLATTLIIVISFILSTLGTLTIRCVKFCCS